MPPLARKLLVCATVDGLVLQPLPSRKDQRPPPAVKLKYGDATISTVPRDTSSAADPKPSEVSFESFGVVGLITVAPHSYLITITRRQQVASIRGNAVYVVTEVALTPCSSQREAAEAVSRTAAHLKESRTDDGGDADSDSDSDVDDGVAVPAVIGDDDIGDADDLAQDMPRVSGPGDPSGANTPSVVDDVMKRRGSYGRFAQRWFSRGGWLLDQKRSMGLSNSSSPSRGSLDAAAPKDSSDAGTSRGTGALPSSADDTEGSILATKAANLLPKLLRTAQILFGTSRSFYFSYDQDITRSTATQDQSGPKPGQAELPLFRRVNPIFHWNRHVQQRFIEAGVDAFVLPLMQGFVGQRSFVVDSHPPQVDQGGKESVELSDFVHSRSKPTSGTVSPRSERDLEEVMSLGRLSEQQFDITLVSRRSVKRGGLRYLRRGVDDDGNTANFVETEQILTPAGSSAVAPAQTFSFVQIRGSIPLFFTQSPYSLKPAPVIQHTLESNYQALRKHFQKVREHYGSIQIVNLVEKHGIEAPLGEQYERGVQRLNEESGPDQETPFEWFDFHAACRGMKFENVSLLLDILGKKIEAMGSTVVAEAAGTPVVRQKGVLRTNCMDCLDRTNVCQSSFAKLMLEVQLRGQGFDLSAQRDQETAWFNTLWADNGDAISKQYASTAAMKGDFTRTKKRDYRGVLTDVGLSATRFFSGMVNDFFVQATIDFLLGNVTSLVFEEFEVDMMTKDPAVSMQKLREQAIELCQKRVVEDEHEEFIGGWTMLTPRDPSLDNLITQPFEEAVLLLTDVALYLCRFDWNLDKVSSFERVELSHVRRIRFGTYITAAMSPTQMDPTKNQGILITYRPGSNDIVRVNTRSMSSLLRGDDDAGGGESSLQPPAAASAAEASAPRPTGLAGILARRLAPPPPVEKRIALKALYTQSSFADPIAGGLTEIQQVVSVSAQLERLVVLNQPVSAGSERNEILESADIVSLAEAKRSTGLLEQLGHSIKRLVWA